MGSVGEKISDALKEWKVKFDEISQRTSAKSASAVSSGLSSAMDELPEMQGKKKMIDMHVTIASKMLKEIGNRSIMELAEFEEEIMGASGRLTTETKNKLFDYLRKETSTSDELTDKIRLLIIMAQCLNDKATVEQAIEVVKNPSR